MTHCITLSVSDNILQSLVLQQTKPAEMDRPGEAFEETAGQVWPGAHGLLWGGVLCADRLPASAGDHTVSSRNSESSAWETGVPIKNYLILIICQKFSMTGNWHLQIKKEILGKS